MQTRQKFNIKTISSHIKSIYLSYSVKNNALSVRMPIEPKWLLAPSNRSSYYVISMVLYCYSLNSPAGQSLSKYNQSRVFWHRTTFVIFKYTLMYFLLGLLNILCCRVLSCMYSRGPNGAGLSPEEQKLLRLLERGGGVDGTKTETAAHSSLMNEHIWRPITDLQYVLYSLPSTLSEIAWYTVVIGDGRRGSFTGDRSISGYTVRAHGEHQRIGTRDTA
jgi:hypothetical protein